MAAVCGNSTVSTRYVGFAPEKSSRWSGGSGHGAIADVPPTCQNEQMDWFRWLKRETRNPFWNCQPLWVKLITVTVAIPAWLVFASIGVVRGDIGSPYADGAAVIFASVAILQMIFVGRALWRHDI